MRKIFVNGDKQLRSGWKIAIVFCSLLIMTFVIALIVTFAYIIPQFISNPSSSAINELKNDKILNTIGNYAQIASVIFSVILFWKIFDKKSIKYLGLTNPLRHLKELFFGLLLGAASISLVFIVLLSLGQVELVNPLYRPNITITLATDFILFSFVALNEELFARGYCMTVLKQTKNTWVMVFVSSAIFSVMHLGNPNVKPLALINIFLVGILFAYMFLKTNNLWMPIGYHLTWNYFQGNIFGFPVSGTEVKGVYNLKLVSESIINGGGFGPEGGLAVTGVILIGIALIWILKGTEKDGLYLSKNKL